MRCPSCAKIINDPGRFCPSCGVRLTTSSTPTESTATLNGTVGVDEPRGRPADETADASEATSPSNRDAPHGRFVTGTVIANRYRVITLLGRGGMGEVYRAEDLKLEQEVALKFLPKEIKYDGAALARLHREVRIARQVSHRNVCRVFDIEGSDGLPFLTMEYVDGEDLQALLRRIGRFPQDRGIDLARQICGGLAAAHEFGILHRDLKPANIMIDAKGRVRIMDFGLAVLAQSAAAEEMRSGTPAYMAPEQLHGEKLTLKSDIYSLGLVLYEIFTGKHAFDAVTLPELIRQREQCLPKSPSTEVRDLDPLVDSVILQCLQEDPAKRPASALHVVVGLPGGDPIRAALAAGETPSPEMIAVSGPSEGLRPIVAWGLLVAAWILMVGTVVLCSPTRFYNHIRLTQSPEALRERAGEFIQKVGNGGLAADSVSGFDSFNDYLNHYILERQPANWENLSPLSLILWYRRSPQFLVSSSFLMDVTKQDPPLTDPGMIEIEVDAGGRVTHYIEVPQQKDGNLAVALVPDWSRILSEAGYENTGWTPVAPQRTPQTYADARAAYEGTLSDIPGAPTRVELATLHGKLVSLETIFPWSRHEETRMATSEKWLLALFLAVPGITLFWSFWLCRRNVINGRGDRRGAFRLAFAVFSVYFIEWILSGHHVPALQEILNIIRQVSIALLIGAMVWVLYLALEPQVRRHWPSTTVSWSRVLAVKLCDPLVGRDVLIGCLAGALSSTLEILKFRIPAWLGGFQFVSLQPVIFTDTPHAVSAALFWVNVSLVEGIGLFLLIAFLRSLLRRRWMVYGAVALGAFLNALPLNWTSFHVFPFCVSLVVSFLFFVVLIRFGLVTVVVWLYVSNILQNFPVTFDTSTWFFGAGFLGLLIPVLLAAYGFYFSLGDKPVFGRLATDE